MCLVRWLDGWRFLTIILIGSLAGVSSSSPVAESIPGSVRFIALTALIGWLVIGSAGGSRHRQIDPRQRRSLRRIGQGIVAFLAFAAGSAAWSEDSVRTISQAGVFALTIGTVVATAYRRWGDRQTLIGDLRIVHAVLLALTVVSLFGGLSGAAFAHGYRGRFHGFFDSANATGMIAAMVIPLALGLKSLGRSRAFHWASILASAATLVLSQSRGAIVSVIGAVAVMGLLGGMTRVAKALATLTVVVVGVILPISEFGLAPSISETAARFQPAPDGDYSSSRLVAWRLITTLWEERPFLGYGFRSTELLFQSEQRSGGFAFGPDTAHNGYLQILLELGLVGTVLFGLVVLRVWKVVRKGRSRLQIGLIGSMAGGLLFQITESPIFGTGAIFPFVFWLLVAAAVVEALHNGEQVTRPDVGPRPRLRVSPDGDPRRRPGNRTAGTRRYDGSDGDGRSPRLDPVRTGSGGGASDETRGSENGRRQEQAALEER